jgi:hypothetical protein
MRNTKEKTINSKEIPNKYNPSVTPSGRSAVVKIVIRNYYFQSFINLLLAGRKSENLRK